MLSTRLSALRSIRARPLIRLYSTRPSPRSVPPSSSSEPPLEVDSLCLPLASPYTLSSLLPPPSSSTSPLTPETLSKLHTLSALLPPSPTTSTHLKGLSSLISIVENIRTIDTSSLNLKPGEMVDARIRVQDEEEVEPIDLFANQKGKPKEALEVDGETLLRGAERREGRFFVAQMPENVRRRKSSSTSNSAEGEEEPY
ncbi:hypothetical protein JCM16303_003674 [Sporobolomyces ruberrimus]